MRAALIHWWAALGCLGAAAVASSPAQGYLIIVAVAVAILGCIAYAVRRHK